MPLTYIINTSILQGKFPTSWKKAKIIPIHKKGDRKIMKNYRPVSLLNVAGMVCERIVCMQIEDFFERNSLFGEFQFGFRKQKSTVSELLTLFDNLMQAKGERQEIALLLYDLSSAFDTVDPGILIAKLKLYGFDKGAMSWVESYLSGRQQCVQVQGKVSEPMNIDIGTPQGSRLSPLLFVVLMAELDLYTQRSTLTNYADDTQSIIIANSKRDMLDIVQAESAKVINFFGGVNLVNNPDKACIIYNSNGKGETMEMNIGGEALVSKEKEKLLGLYISSDLDWKAHVEELCTKLKQRLGLLRRIRYKIDSDKLKIVAEAIINSKIRYGIAVYGQPKLCGEDPQSVIMQKLQVIQNDMIRMVCGYKRGQHINMESLAKKCNIMSVNQMTVYHILLEMFNILHKNSSEELKRKILEVQTCQNYNLRSKENGDLRIPNPPKRNCVGFSYIGPKTWKLLPPDIKSITLEHLYKNQVKKWIWKSIPFN